MRTRQIKTIKRSPFNNTGTGCTKIRRAGRHRSKGVDQQILTYICTVRNEKGFPPTIREIASAMGCSASTVMKYLGELEEEGLIRRTPGSSRAIKVLVKR